MLWWSGVSARAELCGEAVPWVLALPHAATDAPAVQQDIGRLLIFLAQCDTPARAVAAFQLVLGAGIRVSAACVAEGVSLLAARDASCCAALRQTAAVAGFGPGHPPSRLASPERM